MSDEIIINIFDDPVQSVNGQTGDVVLDISESILKGPVISLSGQLLTTGTISSMDVPVYIAGTKPGYRLEVVNRANFDPGEPFTVDGRARVVHGMNFAAGIPNFTNGSDHSHVFWTSQGRRSWQMIQNGGLDSDNSQFGENNIFQLTTPMNNMAQTRFNELQIHSVDTTDLVTNVNTAPYIATNLKINYNTVTPILVVGQFCQVNFNLGFAGIVASTYVGKVISGPTSVQINGQTKFQYTFQIEGLDDIHWLPSIKGLVPVTFNASLDRMGLIVLTGQQIITGTQTGLTGNYLNVGRYVLVGQENHNAYVGAPVVLSVTTTPKIGLLVRDYNAYVKDVIDNNHYMLSVGNAFLWPNTTGTTGANGWTVYKGSTDGVHQYTPATQHFWFQRFKTNDVNTTTTGGSRAVALGSGAETNGYFTYALGYNSSILKNTTGPALTASSVFGGYHSFVQGSYATALGGQRLTIKRDNQTAIGKFNNPDTDALLVIGNGSSENNRSNILEAHTNKLSISGSLETTGSVLSAGINLFDIFSTLETDSQSLSFDESSKELSITGGNMVSLSSFATNNLIQSTSGQFALSSHSSTHHTGGTDAIAPSSIGAQTLFTTTTLNLTANTTLTAARATNYSVINSGNYTITLPTTGHLVGDIVVVRYTAGAGTLTVTGFLGSIVVALNEQRRFVATGTGANNWSLVPVDTHTHDASQITNLGTAALMNSSSFAPSNLYQDLSGNWNSVYSNVNSTSAIAYSILRITGQGLNNGTGNILPNINNSTETLITWNNQTNNNIGIIEANYLNGNVLIKSPGIYNIKVRFSCFDMQDPFDYLRLRLRSSNTPITNASAGTLVTTLGWRFMAGAIDNGAAYIDTNYTYIYDGSVPIYLALTVFGTGGSAQAGTSYYPNFNNASNLEPYLEILKIK